MAVQPGEIVQTSEDFLDWVFDDAAKYTEGFAKEGLSDEHKAKLTKDLLRS
jgi:hypothetical protein